MSTLAPVDLQDEVDQDTRAEILDNVRRLNILDTPGEQSFDDIVMLAKEICHTPVATIGLVAGQRHWFKAKIGIGVDEVASPGSMCEVTTSDGETVVVDDCRSDPRFADRPAVNGPPFLRFYAGVPLRDAESVVVGSLAVADVVPRSLTNGQIQMLEALGRQVEQLFVLRSSLIARSRDRVRALSRENHFRSVLHSLAHGVIVYDHGGAVADCNPAAESILGANRSELIGQVPFELATYHEDGTPFRTDDRPAAITLKYGIEVRDVVMGLHRRDDSRRWLLVNSSPLWNQQHRSAGAAVTFADVTDLFTLNNQLQESLGELAKAAQERAAMLSSVSHDIRAPLAAIRMMTEILDDRADAITDIQRSELVRRVRAEARRTEGVLADLVSANRVGTGLDAPRRRRIDLEQLIYARAREFDADSHSIRVGILTGDLTMWADSAQVERIVDNLVSNAVTHTHAGARITIGATEADGCIDLVVDDDGPGVPAHMRVRVFSAYVRGERAADRPGTGLGLFLVQQFAQFHGGSARCTDSPQGGARFVVTFPRRPGQPAGAPDQLA